MTKRKLEIVAPKLRCANPKIVGRVLRPCNHCEPCLERRRAMKVSEMVLESQGYKESAFVHLTYDDEHLPLNGSLVKSDVQKFFKRMRKAGYSLRYVLCGEYGEQNGRPHYHAVFYGFDPCLKGQTFVNAVTNSCCPVCDAIRKHWGHGFVRVGPAGDGAYHYIAKYILKGQSPADKARFAASGRAPPFYVKSQFLGNALLPDLCLNADAVKYVEKKFDAPSVIKSGGVVHPLPPRLKKIARLVLLGSEAAPPVVYAKMSNDIEEIHRYARSVGKSVEAVLLELGKAAEDRVLYRKKLQASFRLKFKGFK